MNKICIQCKKEFIASNYNCFKCIDCKKLIKKECDRLYRLKNLKYCKDKQKKYRKENDKKIKTKLKIWRNNNKDKIRALNKKYTESGYASNWKKTHKESVKKTYQKRYKLHKEFYRLKSKKRNDRLKQLAGSHTEKEWKKLCKKWGYTCSICRKKKKLTKDHIIPIWEDNSTNDIMNIRPLCGNCNSSEGAKYQHRKKVELSNFKN